MSFVVDVKELGQVSVPNSILSVLLVVVWLFVLVPMFVNRRPKVMTVTQAALNTRVLFRGGLDRLKHRIHPSAAPVEYEEDEEEESTARRPVAEVFADEHDDLEPEFVEDAEFVENDAPPRRIREQEIVDDAEIVAVTGTKTSGRPPRREDADREEQYDLDQYDQEGDDLDEESLEQIAHRLGRGGYNPSADASARAQRYAIRQRFVLGLLISLIAATVLALAMTPLVWYAAGVIAAALIGYLAYLRRQVRIEERIRARRMARFARSSRTEQREAGGYAAPRSRAEQGGPERGEQTGRPVKRSRGPQVVAIDEDDPDFAFLPSPHEGRLRRASGE